MYIEGQLVMSAMKYSAKEFSWKGKEMEEILLEGFMKESFWGSDICKEVE